MPTTFGTSTLPSPEEIQTLIVSPFSSLVFCFRVLAGHVALGHVGRGLVALLLELEARRLDLRLGLGFAQPHDPGHGRQVGLGGAPSWRG